MAVYTELSHDEIQGFLDSYDLPRLQEAEGIRGGVENTNYLIRLDDGRSLILTLFEKRVRTEDLPFFAGLMEHLASAGIPSPMPIHARDGSVIQTLKGKKAIIVTFLEGKSTEVIENQHIAELGAYLAKLHLAGRGYGITRRNTLSLPDWKNLAARIIARADEIAIGLAKELTDEIVFLESAWPDGLPRGVIHADLFPDNVFFDEKDRLTGMIDFYFACNDFLAYDLAVCINSWCFEEGFRFSATKMNLLLESYARLRPLAEVELDALPTLLRGAALRFLLTRAYDWLNSVEGALVAPKDPLEYLAKLRFFRTYTGQITES